MQTGEPPARDEHGEVLLSDDTGIVFVLLPGADFLQGAQPDDEDAPNFDPGALGKEGLTRSVRLDLPRWRPQLEVKVVNLLQARAVSRRGHCVRLSTNTKSKPLPGRSCCRQQATAMNHSSLSICDSHEAIVRKRAR